MRQQDWARLAKFVRNERLRLGFASQQALASAAGISMRTVGSLERGDAVGYGTLSRIEQALGWVPGDAHVILTGGVPASAQSPNALPVVVADRAIDAVNAARRKIINFAPEQLLEVRSLIEEMLGREAADEWTMRAMRVRETGRDALAQER